jgi:hypothetical protein
MVLDLKRRTYRDLGDMEQMYAFIVLDSKGRAYHPLHDGGIARFDPDKDRLEKLPATIDGKPARSAYGPEGKEVVLIWDISPGRKTLYCVEMTTNALFAFDVTEAGAEVRGQRIGPLLPGDRATDCRAMCVARDGVIWAAVTDTKGAEGPTLHLVSWKPGEAAPRDHGPVGIANPDYTPFTDAACKPLPWHHTVRRSKDGTLTPWVPMGICAAADGTVYITTLAPFTLLRCDRAKLR